MKIISGNKVYVQNIDISRLLQMVAGLGISCPEGVLNQIYAEWFICGPDNQYEFKEYEGKEIVDLFSKLDYIIDYDSIKDLSDDELMTLGDEICTKRNELARKYNYLTFNDIKDVNVQRLYYEIKQLDYKLQSLSRFYGSKKRKFASIRELDCTDDRRIKKQNILSRIFKKRNN